MKKLKNFITPYWAMFLILYVGIFLFSVGSVMITVDEYDGGNKIADFGTKLFDVFTFPFFTLLDNFNFGYNSKYNILISIGFFLNLTLNFILVAIISNTLFNRVKKQL